MLGCRFIRAFLGFLFLWGALTVGAATLQAQSYEGNSQAAANEVRLQQLETEIRRLNGQIEEQNYKIRTLEENLQRATEDMALRVQELEGGVAVNSAAGGAVSQQPYVSQRPAQPTGSQSMTQSGVTTQPFQYAPPVKSDSDGQLGTINSSDASYGGDQAVSDYERAFSLLKASNFPAAEEAFSAFMKAYPDHVLFSNAQYWYGETFYVRGDYDKASRIFAEGYQTYPNGSKAPDNLLKLGMSLSGLGKGNDACIALKQLQEQYSTAAGPVLRRGKQEMQRLGC